MIFPVKRLYDLGFEILATEGTAEVLRRNGVPSTVVLKWNQREGGARTTIVDRIHAGEVDLIVNTPWGTGTGGGAVRVDGYEIRTAAVTRGIPCMTTIQGLAACVQGIDALIRGEVEVTPLQEYHAILRAARSLDDEPEQLEFDTRHDTGAEENA